VIAHPFDRRGRDSDSWTCHGLIVQ
jgi:hypothetical protein